MLSLKVQGTRQARSETTELGRGLPIGAVTVKDAAEIQTARAGAHPVSFDGLQPDDVVEIELQDGLHIWTRVEDVPRDLRPRSQRGDATGAIELPSELMIGPASRSAGGWAIKALKIVGIDVDGEIADFVSAHVESKLQPGPGLYRCAETDATDLRAVGSLDRKGPVLVFLHGTASSTAGSFSGLWSPESGNAARALFEYYGGRVLAYQHKTLTESPIANTLALATDLAHALGPDAELHLVSHSRGGLVGELLARGMRAGAAPITPDELSLFDAPNRASDRKALEQLSQLLMDSRLRVTKFVRVACPARGTTLADNRLDRYVSILVNLGAVAGLKGNPVYDGLTSLLAGVLKKRADPSALPGIEAMMPTSPLVRMLNRPDIATAADLHVLGGDLAGAGLLGRLKSLATDFYYRDDHDLVVNTPAMLGGVERKEPVRYWIDTGSSVTHFHYFARTDTARRVVSALTGSSADFRTLEARPSAVTSTSYIKRATLTRPVVFVLPGIMGSELRDKGDRSVWVNLFALAQVGLSTLSASNGIKATGLLPDGYAALCAFLHQSHEVRPFPYDWRKSVCQSAQELRAVIEDLLPAAQHANQPIRLLAHSMGGLVVRSMLGSKEGQETWQKMCQHPGARLVMLGTPNAGSHAIPAMLIGRDPLVKKLALVDLRSTHEAMLGVIASFEGVLNLLPHAGSLDLFDTGVWNRLLDLDAPETRGLFESDVASSKAAGFRWVVPARDALDRAKKLADEIRRSPLDPARVVYVAGVADETACDLVIDEQAASGRKVKVMASAHGDGRVLWETGIPKGVRAYFMDTIHGELANDRRHFAAIVDVLATGTTSKLSTTAPVRREVETQFEMRDAMPSMVPDEAELVAAALGGRREKLESAQSQARISVRVVHDNVTNAKHPVLLGHYRHDVIVAAEKYLDQRLNQRLSERLRMELYPGPINTGVVVLNERAKGDLSLHPGCIVSGLGMIGELSPGALTSTLAHALTLYGAERVDRERRRRQREGRGVALGGSVRAPVTAILVGSGDGGLTLADSIHALLRAVLQANRRLRPPDGANGSAAGEDMLTAQIDELDIFELYEDRAIEAVHTLRMVAQSAEFDNYVVNDLLVRGDEGVRRLRFEQATGWWQRIRITSDRKGALQFEALTQAARMKARLRPTQRRLVDGFVERAIEATRNDPTVGQTLFETLVPNDFKSSAPDRRKLALMLNPEAATLPWELLHDAFDRTSEPLSVASGLVRQLIVEEEREHVLRPPDNTALVLGNPFVSDPGGNPALSDPRFPPLPGATAEAMLVASLLGGGGYQVKSLLERAADPMSVLTAIHAKPWRILHLAAHGVFDFDTPRGRVSGLVMDDGLFFTAAEAEQMRYVPELVFINCCHLGQMKGETRPHVAFHKLAANVATQFIKMGARAVVAAGWAVDDAAAKTFASSFYGQMLRGTLYGDAVLRARKETFIAHRHTNTWGAYQCYGDPSFSLSVGTSVADPTDFVADAELRIWLDGLVAKARQQQGGESAMLAELEARESQTPSSWWESAELCALAAQGFAELGQFERAIPYYERVVTAERARAPMVAAEQLANCKVRWAGALARASPPDPEKAEQLLKEAEKTLNLLLGLGETSERWSLLGGVMKRRALLAADDVTGRREALRQMSKAYERAYNLLQRNGSGDAYPLGNQIAADIVLSWTADADQPVKVEAISKRLRELEDVAASLASQKTDAFNLSAAADRMLLEALLKRTLDEATRECIQEKFLSALSRGASAKQRDSIKTQFDFFRRLMDTELPEPDRPRVTQQLTLLQEKVL